jgi:hypothetical protein
VRRPRLHCTGGRECGSRSFWLLWRSCSAAATPIRRSIPPDRRTAARTIPAAILTIPRATRRTTSGSAVKSGARRRPASYLPVGRGRVRNDRQRDDPEDRAIHGGPPRRRTDFFSSSPDSLRRQAAMGSDQSRLGFLGTCPFRWISLDSLVRIETYQWVTRDFPRNIFLEPRLGARGRNRRLRSRPFGRAGLFMRQAYFTFWLSAII